MDERKEEDLIDLWFEPETKQSIGRNILRQFMLLHVLLSSPKQFIQKLGPFVFVNLVLIVTLIVIVILLSPSK